MLPNFICPGAARSATTSLYYLLIQHPQVYLPRVKETRFFAVDYDMGAQWYESRYYSQTENKTAVGDISPVYLVHEECPKRIFESLGPSVKFIFMLRNPASRVISHYQLLKRMQIEDLPLAEALEADSRHEKSMQHFRHEFGFQYLKESTYSKNIKRYLEYYPMSQMKFIIFEEFVRDLESHLADITTFLEVDSCFKFNLDLYQNQNIASTHATLNRLFYGNSLSQKIRTFIQMNTGWKTQVLMKKLKNTILSSCNAEPELSASIDDDMMRKLHGYFTDEVRQLTQLIGRDLSIWSPGR